MVRCFFFIFIFLTSPAFSQSIISNGDFKKAIYQKDYSVWHHYSDFAKIYSFFTPGEQKDYEWGQRATLESDQRGEKILGAIEILAIKRAYPEFSKLLNDTVIERSFYSYFQKKYSYGWLRRKAWKLRRLADPGGKSAKRFSAQVFLDQSRNYKLTFDGHFPTQEQLLGSSYDLLLSLALCEGYKPAIQDVVQASRVQGQLKLSQPLSYLLMLRVKQKKMRVIFKGEWLNEIDAVLTEHQKQRYRSLIGDRQALSKEISYCKA